MGKQLVKIVKEICEEQSLKFKTYSDDYIMQIEANKKVMFIFGNKFPNNNATIEQICNDKCALSDLLEYYKIPHVPHIFFNSPKLENYIPEEGNWMALIELLDKYNELVLKVNRGTGGKNIYKVTNQKELEIATLKIFKNSNSMSVSPFYKIKDEYRVIIVGNEFQYAFKKIRPYVIGNGKNKIIELFNKLDNKDKINISNDIDMNYIPNINEKVELSWKHNLGLGAVPEVIEDENLKEKLINLAKNCILNLNLGFVSIDIIDDGNELKVLEINSGVMIENFSQHSEKYYNLAKNAVKRAIELYLNLDKKFKLNRRKKEHFVLPVLTKIAKDKKISIIEDKEEQNFAIFLFPNGKKFVARDFPFNINDGGSIALCSNKSACNSFLNSLGYSTPKEKYFVRGANRNTSIKKVQKFIDDPSFGEEFSYPVIIKPNNLSQGEGVYLARNSKDCIFAVQDAFSKSSIVLLQEYCKGNEYRVVVLYGKVIQFYQRVPFYVVGNGIDTIKQLIENKILTFIKYGRDREVTYNDTRILKNIELAGYTIDSVLENNKKLILQDIANLSLGGESIDVFDNHDKSFDKIAIDIAISFNLRLCGIDLIVNDINDFEKGYKVLEINSGPGLDNYLYPKEKQNRYIEELYSLVLDEIEKHS